MTRRTRYFLLGAALTLLLGLGTGLVAYYRGDLPLFQPRVGPAALAYVPATATGLAYANVRQIMDSEFRQKLREVMPTGQGKDEFLRETGIDVEHDIQEVVAAAAGTGDPSGHGLVLIRGQFDEARIEALVRQHDGAVTEYRGKRLMRLPDRRPGGTGAEAPYLVFAEPGLAMFGSEATVKQAVDTRESGNDVTGNGELMKLVARLDAAGNTAWAVGGVDALASNPNIPPQVRDQLPALEWVAISARVSDTVNGRLLAEAKDEKAAADLKAVVNGAIAAGHLMAGRDQRVDAFLNTLQVSGAGRELDLSFSLPPQILEMMHGAAAQRHVGTPAAR